MGNRGVLQSAVESSTSSGTPGAYAHSLGWVNFAMQKLGVGLSGRQLTNMLANIKAVDAGLMTNAQASAGEGIGFIGDVLNRGLPNKDRAGALMGVIANSLFGSAFHFHADLNNYNKGIVQGAEVRMMMHAHVSGDVFS